MKSKRFNSMRIIVSVQIVVVVFLAIALNVLAVNLSRRAPLSVDLTANSRYALSEASQVFLDDLPNDIRIHVLANQSSFAQASTYTRYASVLLEQYAMAEKVHVDYVDYTRDPTFASKFPNLTLEENGMVIECEDRATAVKLSELFEYSYTSTEEIQVTAVGEARLASAISDVLYAHHARALVLTGNGAQQLEGLREILDVNGFDVSEASLATGNLDSQADLLILAAPTVDLTEEQISALEAWLVNGGDYGKTLFYAADVTQMQLPRLEALLRDWGVEVEDGAVFETSADRTSQNQPFFATAQFVQEDDIQAFADAGAPVIAPMARPLSLRFSHQEAYDTRTLLQFSETSGVRPSDAPENFTAADATQWGPIPVLVESTLNLGKISRIYVSGSTSLLDSKILGGNAFLNQKYLLKLFSEIGEGMDLSAFTGKALTDERVHIPTSTAGMLGVLLTIVLPLALMALGAMCFIKRRKL